MQPQGRVPDQGHPPGRTRLKCPPTCAISMRPVVSPPIMVPKRCRGQAGSMGWAGLVASCTGHAGEDQQMCDPKLSSLCCCMRCARQDLAATGGPHLLHVGDGAAVVASRVYLQAMQKMNNSALAEHTRQGCGTGAASSEVHIPCATACSGAAWLPNSTATQQPPSPLAHPPWRSGPAARPAAPAHCSAWEERAVEVIELSTAVGGKHEPDSRNTARQQGCKGWDGVGPASCSRSLLTKFGRCPRPAAPAWARCRRSARLPREGRRCMRRGSARLACRIQESAKQVQPDSHGTCAPAQDCA